jgi:hypothetical protein
MFEFESLRDECSTELAASSRGIVALRFDHVNVVGGQRPRGPELACELLQCAPVVLNGRAGDQWMLGRATGGRARPPDACVPVVDRKAIPELERERRGQVASGDEVELGCRTDDGPDRSGRKCGLPLSRSRRKGHDRWDSVSAAYLLDDLA